MALSTPDADRRPPRPLFSARATAVVRLVLLGVVFTGGAAGYGVYEYYHSPYWNRVGLAPAQPVLFSHRHHAGELRIDCRFCHTAVETSADAGMPSTQTCLTCHSQLFRDAPMLQPVQASAAENAPLLWSRVSTLPDHVYFNHSAHVSHGIACANCHGEVADMALTAKARPLTMRDCLACHRDPEPQRVSADEVFARIPPEKDPASSGLALTPVHARPLTNCSTCHH